MILSTLPMVSQNLRVKWNCFSVSFKVTCVITCVIHAYILSIIYSIKHAHFHGLASRIDSWAITTILYNWLDHKPTTHSSPVRNFQETTYKSRNSYSNWPVSLHYKQHVASQEFWMGSNLLSHCGPTNCTQWLIQLIT